MERVYKEQVSGTKGEADRPVFMEMIADILSNGVRTIVVKGLDKLAREYRIQEQLLIYLSCKDIEPINASTGENITEAIQSDPVRKALVQIQGVFAELEKNQIVHRLRKAREKKRKENKNGHCEGIKPHGDLEGEAEIVERIQHFRYLQKGQHRRMSYREISDKLNTEGIRTRMGKPWRPKAPSGMFIFQEYHEGAGTATSRGT
jgi:site-specific DNA recombinase